MATQATFSPVTVITLLQLAVRGNIQAGPDATQANAVPLTLDQVNVVTVAPVVGAGVLLPPATGTGRIVVVVNNAAANSVNQFPRVGERIGTNAINTAINIVVSRTNWFIDVDVGVWSSPVVF